MGEWWNGRGAGAPIRNEDGSVHLRPTSDISVPVVFFVADHSKINLLLSLFGLLGDLCESRSLVPDPGPFG